MAASIWDLSNPIASIFATASSRSDPTVNADGSLNAASGAAERTGVGVARTGWAAGSGAGALGATGVLVTARAGVAGTAAAVLEEAGAALGWTRRSTE